MEKFTAAQARAMASNKIPEMLERIHLEVRNAASLGDYEVNVKFCDELSFKRHAFKVKSFLENEGYNVILCLMQDYFSFTVNWEE